MFLLNYKYVIIGAITFILLGGIVDRFLLPKGNSHEDMVDKIRLQLLEQQIRQDRINYNKKIEQDEITSKNITADSTFIWTTEYITDSLRNYYNPR